MDPSQQEWRRSRLEPADAPLTLVVADLHNHSLNSDGRGDPERAFELMRAAGLDVAALTDHVLSLLRSLPAGETYENVQDVAKALGLHVETHRF